MSHLTSLPRTLRDPAGQEPLGTPAQEKAPPWAEAPVALFPQPCSHCRKPHFQLETKYCNVHSWSFGCPGGAGEKWGAVFTFTNSKHMHYTQTH